MTLSSPIAAPCRTLRATTRLRRRSESERRRACDDPCEEAPSRVHGLPWWTVPPAESRPPPDHGGAPRLSARLPSHEVGPAIECSLDPRGPSGFRAPAMRRRAAHEAQRAVETLPVVEWARAIKFCTRRILARSSRPRRRERASATCADCRRSFFCTLSLPLSPVGATKATHRSVAIQDLQFRKKVQTADKTANSRPLTGPERHMRCAETALPGEWAPAPRTAPARGRSPDRAAARPARDAPPRVAHRLHGRVIPASRGLAPDGPARRPVGLRCSPSASPCRDGAGRPACRARPPRTPRASGRSRSRHR
jgi:hypothetical protein